MPAEPSPQQSAIAQAVALLDHYAFDTGRLACADIVLQWLDRYEPDWIRAAAIEALYLGRYKAVSVEQILEIWQRRGQPATHFNGDFERLICRKLPNYSSDAVDAFLLDEYARAASAADSVVAETADTKALRPEAPVPAAIPALIPTAERGAPRSTRLAIAAPPARAAIARPFAPPPFGGLFRSPIRIYAPPADTSEFYARLRRFLARSLTQPAPPPPAPRPEADWVLELGTWHVELDDDRTARPDADAESASSEPCDCT